MKNHLSCNIAKGIISPIAECMFDFDISSTCPSKESTFALKREKKWFEGINVNHFLQPRFFGNRQVNKNCTSIFVVNKAHDYIYRMR